MPSNIYLHSPISSPIRLFSIYLLIVFLITGPVPIVGAQNADREPAADSRLKTQTSGDDPGHSDVEVVEPETDHPGPGSGSMHQDQTLPNEPADPSHIVDRVHEDLTRRMVSTAEWFDSFFDDERYIDEQNQTTLRLQFDTFLKEYEEIDFDVRARLDLKVPGLEDNLENKFKIIISGDQEDNSSLDDFDDERPGEIAPEDEQGNFSLAGEYFFLNTLKRNASARVGVKFRSLQPEAFVEGRYRAEETFDVITTRFIPKARWWTDRGWELRTDFDIEAPLEDNLLFRTTLAGSWQEEKDGIFYDVRFRIFQRIDKIRALEYQWYNKFQTEPKHRLTQITYRVAYRQQFWRKWLYYEIAPEVALREFDVARDYRFVPGILLRLEIRFEGKDRLKSKPTR